MDNELRDDVISAALDGERVDIDALRRALATPDGRDALAAFVMLRAVTVADDVAPPRRVDDLTVAARRPRRWPIAGPRVPAAWAASIAILAVAASFWFGTTLRAPNSTLTVMQPPAAPATTFAPPIVDNPTGAISGNREVYQRPRAAGGSRVRRVVDVPPTPTRVLRFVPGVDWTSAPE